MFNYIKLPEHISLTQYDLDPTNYKDEYIIKKEKEKVLLIKKEYFSEVNSFWFINDIANEIKKNHNECIFALIGVDKETQKFSIVLGNTIDRENLGYYSFIEEDINDTLNLRKQIHIKLEFLERIFGKKKIIVFLEKNISEILVEEIFSTDAEIFSTTEFKDLLRKSKSYEKEIIKYFPFIITSIIGLILYLFLSNFIESINLDNKETFDNKNKELLQEIEIREKDNLSIKKKIAFLNEKLSKVNLNNNAYTGE